MALFLEFSSLVGLITRPFVLVCFCCQFGIRNICIVIQTWIELLRAALYLHLVIFWKLAIWVIALLSLPVRAFAALYREKKLEMHVYRMNNELENILWDKKELQGRLQIALKERRMMEVMLTELENEHDEAIVKIELLERKVRDLMVGVQKFGEGHGGDICNMKKNDDFGTSSWKLGNQQTESEQVLEDDMHDLVEPGSKFHVPAQQPYTTEMILKNSVKSDIVAKLREFAIFRSLFSAVLSVLVGIIVWEAKDPCMPLVVALFSVVSMSLVSVVQFLNSIEDKPPSDAVALLSFNWFILGTLAYPTLPRVAHELAPLTSGLFGRTFRWPAL